MITTKSGKYIIFDVTDPAFFPGKKIPEDFQKASINGTCFFQPVDWDAENSYGGIVFAKMRGFPMAYSQGHSSYEEALAEAQKWEDEEPMRQRRDATNAAAMNGIATFNL